MNTDNIKILCSTLGGSHAYGLQTPTSDIDKRGVFANTDLSSIIGINSGRSAHRVSQNDDEDTAYWEIREFLRLLRQGNTQAVELAFTDKWEKIDPSFVTLKFNRSRLIDSQKLITVLKGYSLSELRLANGERTGKLGGKRKEAIEKYGFSPKNFVQLFRLLWAGRKFYESGIFPVCVPEWDQDFANWLMDVKTNPQDFHKEALNMKAKILEQELEEAYAQNTIGYKFDERAANELCKEIYLPLLDTSWIDGAAMDPQAAGS
jgi:predicted nucleotidyltransferase